MTLSLTALAGLVAMPALLAAHSLSDAHPHTPLEDLQRCIAGEPPLLQVVFLHDMTSSFTDDLAVLKFALPHMVSDLGAMFPGSEFALASFRDKPLDPLGGPGDYCYRLHTAFTKSELAMAIAAGRLRPAGGGDAPESQLEALLNAALSPDLTWEDRMHVGGRRVLKLVVLSSDNRFHNPGELDAAALGLGPHPGVPHADCSAFDYPSMAAVGRALRDRDIKVVALSWAPFQPVYDMLFRVGRFEGISQPLDSTSSDFMDGVIEGLKHFVCGPPTTAPSTPPPQPRAALELLMLQDLSYSYKNDLENIRKSVPYFLSLVGSNFASSRFSLASFVDKPVLPFGYPHDECYRLLSPMTRSVAAIEKQLREMRIRSGLDWEEASLQALHHALLSAAVGWTRAPTTPEGHKVFRLVALLTDAGFHQAGDASDLRGNDGDEWLDCEGEDYPSVAQVADALRRTDTFIIFLVTRDVMAMYEALLARLGGRGVVYEVDDVSSNLHDAAMKATEMVVSRFAI